MRLILLIILFTLLKPTFGAAQVYNGLEYAYSSTFLSTSEGLPHSNVDGLIKDSEGFIWLSFFGGGFARYDGSQFIHYDVENTKGALCSNYVTETDEDLFGRRWIATTSGMNLMDQRSSKFLELPDSIKKTTQGKNCTFVHKDAEGAIWYTPGSKLYRVGFSDNGEIASLDSLVCYDANSENRLKFRDLDKNGSVWTSIDGFIYKVEYIPGKGLVQRPVSTRLYLGDGNNATDFARKESDVWIGTNNGLFRYDITTGNYREYRKERDGLANNQITELAISYDGRVIVGTTGGLSIYNPVSDSFTNFDSVSNQLGDKMLSDDIVRALLINGNQIWVGSELEGITILCRKRIEITNVHHRDNDPSSIANSPVSSLAFDSKGRLWAGTMKQGLFVASDPAIPEFRNISTFNSILGNDAVTALENDGSDRLWVGTRNGGLYTVSVYNGDKLTCIREPDAAATRDLDNVNDLCYDPVNNYMWILTRSGLFWYDLNEGGIHQYNVASIQFFSSAIDSHARMWIGCQTGVYCIDLKRLDHTYFHNFNVCFSVCLDAGGHLWCGSFGKGVYRTKHPVRDLSDIEFININTSNGLADDRIRALLCSGDWIWAATENGLSRISPDTGKVDSFYGSDGLESVQFSNDASAMAPDGKLFFAHRKGFSILNSSVIFPVPRQETILRFTNCTSGNNLDNLAFNEEIHFHEKEMSFTFEFADLSMDFSGKRYYYRMLPVDEEWREVRSANKHVRYERLTGGKYKLEVMASDLKGDILDICSKTISVRPYFYKTWWFICLFIVCVVATVLAYIRFRTKNIERQRARLQQEVEQQTRQLSEQKKELEDRAKELLEQNKLLLKLNEDLAGKKMIIKQGVDISKENGKDSEFIDKLFNKIRGLYKDPDLDVDGLCRAMGISRTVLNGKIQDSLGQSIGQFIRTYRLNIAKEIICSGNKRGRNISEIAYEVGFNDPKYFTRCFTKEFGETPSSMLSGKTQQ